MDSDIHVLPIDDLRQHDESRTCWCQPQLTVVEKGVDVYVVVHNAMDGRELIEQHGLQ